MNAGILKTGSLALLCCSLCLVGAGCVFCPVSTSRQPISSRKTSDFEFVKSGQPSRSEVETKLGKPDGYFPQLRVSVYPVNTVIRRKLWLFLGIVPVHYFRDYDGFETACIEFDEQDRAQRCGLTTQYLGLSSSALEFGAKKWLATKDEERRH
jgi:hypothetical protein